MDLRGLRTCSFFPPQDKGPKGAKLGVMGLHLTPDLGLSGLEEVELLVY